LYQIIEAILWKRDSTNNTKQ